jgi:RNA polymerase sigma-70 factor (ECF subfamily)
MHVAAYHERRRRATVVHRRGVVSVEALRALVERARSPAVPPERRADAFGQIVRRYQDLVYGYAFSVLGDRDLAQDAAQETFLAAYRALPQLKDPEALPGWLRRVARTHCLRMTRWARRGAAPLPDEHAETGRWTSDQDPVAAAETAELRRALIAAVGVLTPREREATVLFYVSGLPQEDVARFLDVPVTTVKKRLQAARRRMHERMDDMVRETLREHAPSRGGAFADALRFLAGLEAAAAEGELRLLELMAIDGVDLDDRDRDGSTLLGWAARRGHLEALGLLLDAGARVNARDGAGRTALGWAIEAGQHEAAELLRRRGARL